MNHNMQANLQKLQKRLRYGTGAGEEDGCGVSGFPCLVLPVFCHFVEGGATILVQKPKIRYYVELRGAFIIKKRENFGLCPK